MKRVVKTMGERDSDGIKLKEDKDTEEMVDECGGVEVDGGKERLLPLLDVEEDSVEVEHGDGALDSHLAPGPLSIGAYFEKRWSGYQETFGSISMTEIVSGAHFSCLRSTFLV